MADNVVAPPNRSVLETATPLLVSPLTYVYRGGVAYLRAGPAGGFISCGLYLQGKSRRKKENEAQQIDMLLICVWLVDQSVPMRASRR